MTVPVIDFGPAFRGEPGGLEAVAAQVRRASEQVGFFYMAGHGHGIGHDHFVADDAVMRDVGLGH